MFQMKESHANLVGKTPYLMSKYNNQSWDWSYILIHEYCHLADALGYIPKKYSINHFGKSGVQLEECYYGQQTKYGYASGEAKPASFQLRNADSWSKLVELIYNNTPDALPVKIYLPLVILGRYH